MTVVTRFAPSPTGLLHVGNLRPALLNWLFARKAGGAFILRIDDTDAERSDERYVDAIRRDLEWLGLDWDRFERQSERLDRYEAAAEALRQDGRLYPCYETATELALKRKTLLQAGRPPVYDRAALNLTDERRAAYEAEGRRPHWRFRLDRERVVWTDGIRGETSVDCASVSDPVLIREDGGFLYTLCSVCDDADFGVTEVIRGEDHVTNTAVQVQIAKALGAAIPAFAHHSLLVAADGSSLSKRLGSLTLESLRESGIEPLALLSYMARLGSSDPIELRESHGALAERFELSRLGRAPARFDAEALSALNLKTLHGADWEAVTGRLPGVSPSLWVAVRENVTALNDVQEWQTIVADGPPEADLGEDADFVAEALATLPPAPRDETSWGVWTGALKAQTGRKGRALFMPLRLALTGRAKGPEMAALLPLYSDAAIAAVQERYASRM